MHHVLLSVSCWDYYPHPGHPALPKTTTGLHETAATDRNASLWRHTRADTARPMTAPRPFLDIEMKCSLFNDPVDSCSHVGSRKFWTPDHRANGMDTRLRTRALAQQNNAVNTIQYNQHKWYACDNRQAKAADCAAEETNQQSGVMIQC